MIQIDILGRTTLTEVDRQLTALYRLERGDGETSHHHGFGPETWNWGTSEAWYAWWDREHFGEWGYIFFFADGTRGTCRVEEVNQALAALGFAVDRRGDAGD